ncbi:uncharacterized protein PV09_01869 [Verruconis gallopava]|uniref:Cytochrome P450 n=1 Tax=Verruconis gallopava TaxID=253628 RepID=A0A0D2AN87_9PEZI|nr:uncharacterized protein PV09_01869 [Verruconis gallopava]KIW07970.1 hypothetical protein PV09_01869 [Verruconis gallopava]
MPSNTLSLGFDNLKAGSSKVHNQRVWSGGFYFVLGAVSQLLLHELYGMFKNGKSTLTSPTLTFQTVFDTLDLLNGNHTLDLPSIYYAETSSRQIQQAKEHWVSVQHQILTLPNFLRPLFQDHAAIYLLCGSFAVYVIARIALELRRRMLFARHAAANGCLPPRTMPHSSKLSRYLEVSKVDANLLDEYLFKKYQANGLTHVLATYFTKRVKAISTIEPENFKAVLATSFDDWQRPPFRAGAAHPFLKVGILTLDGPHWAYSRKIMKSQFTRKQIDANLAASERHLQDMFEAMGRTDYNGWTDTIDLMEFFFRFAMDSSTEFLFGLSANTQLCAMVRKGTKDATAATVSMDGFEEAFVRVQKHVGVRMKMGKSYWMVDGWGYRKACRDLGNIMDGFTLACMKHAQQKLSQPGYEASNVIEALVANGHDHDYIANQCRHLIIAGFETTSALLGFSFALAERHPRVFAKLRDEVIASFGTEGLPRLPLTFENLKNCKYLQHFLNETLRMYPAGPSIQRVAARDTVLPRGGGTDGTGPIAVPRGATVQLGIYLCHRRTDIWGDDAAEFRPERWEGRKKGYEYIPFIAGPQICLGQQYSVTQVGYVLARFLMRYDAMEKPIGQDNLRKGWQTVLTPGNGVRMRLHLGPDHRALNLLSSAL